jgi:hypothetical protein
MRLKRRELERELFDEPDEAGRLTDSLGDSPAEQSIERSILRSAKKNGGCTTASEVALSGSLAIEDARRALDVLVSKGFAEMRVSKQGTVVYCIPDILPAGGPEIDDGL